MKRSPLITGLVVALICSLVFVAVAFAEDIGGAVGGIYRLTTNADGSMTFAPYTPEPVPTPTVTVTLPVPGPTVTVTASPAETPTPTASPTATETPTPPPSPTPTPTPSESPTDSRTVVYDYVVPSGTTNKVYENIDFVGTKRQSAALTINVACSNLTFRNCTVEGRTWNGVSLNDYKGNIRNITFDGLTVKPCSRMGFEATSRGDATKSYNGLTIRNAIFEPQGSEALSIDGPPVPSGVLIENVLIKGSGTNPAFDWGQGFEVNTTKGVTVNNLTIWRTGETMLNLTGDGSASMGWTFTNCVFDSTVGSMATMREALMEMDRVNGTVWRGCLFNAAEAANGGYLMGSSNNDFTTCTWLPASVYVVERDGSTGNIGLP